MKKFLALAVAVLMLVGMMSLTTSAHRGYTYNSTYGTPVIDGVIDDIWKDSVRCELQFFAGDGWAKDQGDIPLSNYSFRVMNDDEYIYVLAEIYDYTPGDMDFVEFHVDEDWCQLNEHEWEDIGGCPVCYQLRIPVWEPDDFSYGNGYMGSGALKADGTYMDILAECKSVVTRVTTAQGTCNYGVLEFKIDTITPLSDIVKIGIETSYQDFNEDCEWVNFHRWNTDSHYTYDVQFGYEPDVSDEMDMSNCPPWSTVTYAPFYLAAAPGEDEPASEPASEDEPASEPASEDEPASEPASEEPASEEPASEPATQGGNEQPPKTADAGIVVAAVVMAAAAAVVLNKKH